MFILYCDEVALCNKIFYYFLLYCFRGQRKVLTVGIKIEMSFVPV